MPRYRHVIWDWNGTLLDDVQLSLSTVNGLLEEHGLPTVGRDRYREVFDFPVRDYYQRLGFDLTRVEFDRLVRAWLDLYEGGFSSCGLRHDTVRAVQAVAAEGIGQSLLSATEQQRLHAQVAEHDIAHHFRGCVGILDHHAAGKVARAKEWLAELAIDPDHVVLVGDTTHDLEVADALGADCILVLDGHHSESKLRAAGASKVVADLVAVLEHL